MRILVSCLLALLIGAPGALQARIKLTTLPGRERVIIRFEDNGAVLVEEVRTLTLDAGLNQIDFTWLGVNIDRGSIQLLRVDGVDFTVIRTTYPPDEGNSLVWEASAGAAGPAKIRISYLLSGLTREIALRATVAEGTDELTMRVYQRLVNNSGETFDAAALAAAFGDLRDSPLATGEVRQQLAARFAKVPFTKRYTYDPAQFGENVAVHYVLMNTTERGLGTGTLPAAKVRIYQATGETEAFLGEDWGKATARGEELLLRIGDTKDVTVRRSPMKQEQDIVQRDDHNRPALWHELAYLRFEVENFSEAAKTIRLVERTGGEWDVLEPRQVLEKRIAPEKYEPVAGEPNPAGTLTKEDVNTLHIELPVPPMRRLVFTCALRRKNLH
jgi:hypothetical protein